ncbi:hypothetical protein [Kitasatospora sp. NPDC048538]|uniref:hypothetical protein n=1 Tax=unclassified Kitasatospora TaxID=2633591 RepID=UPI0033E5ED42
MPLRRGDRTVGAMGLGRREPLRRARAAARYVDALAGLVAEHLVRVTATGGGEPDLVVPGGEYWFRAVLDAVFEPVLVLSAVREGVTGGAVGDLRVGFANAAAGREAATGRLVGRRLSELHPGLVTAGAFGRILDTAATGVGYEGRVEGLTGSTAPTALRAAPFLDGVLLTWRPGEGAAEHAAGPGGAQRLAGLGCFAWPPASRGGSGSRGVSSRDSGAPARRTRGDAPGDGRTRRTG